MSEAEDEHGSRTIKQQDSHSYPPASGGVASSSNGGGGDNGQVNTDTGLVRPPTRASSYATANESDDDDEGAATPTRHRHTPSLGSLDSQRHTATTPYGHGNDEAQEHNDGDVEYEEVDGTATNSGDGSPTTTTNAMTPAAQLRLSLARRLWSGVSQLRSRSKCALLFQGAFTIAQIAAFITMLALSARQTCIKPLRVFIALHITRIAVAYPVSFYNALAPPSRPPRGEEDTPESRQRREARRVIGNPRLDARLRTASDLISLFSFVWFFLGNVWVYSGGQCRDTSPYMWWSSLAILIISYIRVAELAIIIFAVVFFLPLVIVVLRLFGGLEKKHEIGPLTKEEIAKLPTVYYVPAPEQQEKTSSSAAGTAPESGAAEKPSQSRTDHVAEPGSVPAGQSETKAEDNKTAPKPRRRRHLVRILFKRKRGAAQAGDALSKAEAGQATSNGLYVPTRYPLHPLPDNLSSCPICLSDYEPPPLLTAAPEERDKALEELEPLTLLPCGHSIHKDCLAPWLHTSGRCPVCQRAVLGEGEEQQKKSRLRLRRRRRRGRQSSTNQGDGTAAVAANPSAPPPAQAQARSTSNSSTVPPLPV